MNKATFDEANALVKLPPTTITWNITDIGEGDRVADDNNRQAFEEDIYKEVTANVDDLVKQYNLP